jgi:hypothetical protein
MRRKSVALFTAVMFLILSSACSHSPKKPSSPAPREEISSSEEAPPPSSASSEEPWWKKDEYQWLIAFLIVLGVGIAIGATIYVASGANGLTLQINK